MIVTRFISVLLEAESKSYLVPSVDPIPLTDGDYQCLHYGYCLEIDGKTYKTVGGIRCGREHCGGPQMVSIKNGQASLWWPKR